MDHLLEFLGNAVTPILTPFQKSSLDEDISLNELSLAIKKLKHDKSPGFDGFTTKFVKYFWSRLGGFLHRAVKEF